MKPNFAETEVVQERISFSMVQVVLQKLLEGKSPAKFLRVTTCDKTSRFRSPHYPLRLRHAWKLARLFYRTLDTVDLEVNECLSRSRLYLLATPRAWLGQNGVALQLEAVRVIRFLAE